jgi:hypothetical protein
MASLDRGDSAGPCTARIVVCSTALSSARPRADDALFDDIVIECAPMAPSTNGSAAVVTVKLSRDEALQLCADIALQLKTLPLLRTPRRDRPTP